MSRSDARGEFIQLSLMTKKHLRPDQKRRYKRLKKAWRGVVGILDSVLYRDRLQFRRGLLIGCAATSPSAATSQSIVASLDWAAVERLELRYDDAMEFGAELVFAPHLRRLEALMLPDVHALTHLLAMGSVHPGVVSIELLDGVQLPAAPLDPCITFPSLSSVSVPQEPWQDPPLEDLIRGVPLVCL